MSIPLHRLKKQVGEGRYVVDDELVAEAIIVRIQLNRMIRGCAAFPTDGMPPHVRSFRRAPHACSFRLTRTRTSRVPLALLV
jgi:hypothetical protein